MDWFITKKTQGRYTAVVVDDITFLSASSRTRWVESDGEEGVRRDGTDYLIRVGFGTGEHRVEFTYDTPHDRDADLEELCKMIFDEDE